MKNLVIWKWNGYV